MLKDFFIIISMTFSKISPSPHGKKTRFRIETTGIRITTSPSITVSTKSIMFLKYSESENNSTHIPYHYYY